MLPEIVLLIAYGDHNDVYVVKLLCETTDMDELERAILDAPRTEGGDTPEAMEDALHFACEELDRRLFERARVVVFADAPAHTAQECPYGYDFRGELAALRRHGCSVSLVACNVEPASIGWIGIDGIEVTTLESHSWHSSTVK